MTLDELIAAHPMLQNVECGVSIGEGWVNLVHVLCTKIEAHCEFRKLPVPVIGQVKEKFGGLRFNDDNNEDAYIDGLIAMAEAISTSVCERCGERGELRSGGLIRTLCEGCAGRDKR